MTLQKAMAIFIGVRCEWHVIGVSFIGVRCRIATFLPAHAAWSAPLSFFRRLQQGGLRFRCDPSRDVVRPSGCQPPCAPATERPPAPFLCHLSGVLKDSWQLTAALLRLEPGGQVPRLPLRRETALQDRLRSSGGASSPQASAAYRRKTARPNTSRASGILLQRDSPLVRFLVRFLRDSKIINHKSIRFAHWRRGSAHRVNHPKIYDL